VTEERNCVGPIPGQTLLLVVWCVRQVVETSPAMERYETFVLNHAQLLTYMEGSLRSLTYLLPGKFEESELTSEALYAVLNLVRLYHDHILARTPRAPHTLDHDKNAYVKSMLTSDIYRRVSVVLSILDTLDVLGEMLAWKALGPEKKWKIVWLIEALKVLCKLKLFYAGQKRMLMMHRLLPERDIPLTSNESQSVIGDFWTGKRSHRKFPTLSQFDVGKKAEWIRRQHLMHYLDEASERLKHQKIQSAIHPMDHRIDVAMEYPTILRPLIYVTLLMVYGKKSWRPWMVTVILEMIMGFHAVRQALSSSPSRWTSLEREEQFYRLRLFGYNLLRSPFYDHLTKPQLLAICNSWKDLPILSWVASAIRDYMPLWEQVYFYTAGSS
jgi:peroxin-16